MYFSQWKEELLNLSSSYNVAVSVIKTRPDDGSQMCRNMKPAKQIK
jgi:hypothetical protein